MSKQELIQLINHEGNRYEFTYIGYKCVLIRNHLQVWSGYVGVTPHHPLYGYNYSDIVKVPKEILQSTVDIDKIGLLDFMAFCLQKKKEGIPDDEIQVSAALPVHGGLNYSRSTILLDEDNTAQTESEKIWWFGFDCGHHKDLVPKFEFDIYKGESTYKTKEFVINELKTLVDKLIIFKFGRDEQTGKKTKGN